ncbi:MAG: SPOR domain-containing protein [Bacteroidaceae bacterium]|nr:SPOR domain-containing protein [Bacteroidaceae bacterium]
MKKIFVISAAVLAVISMTSCKSNESAYKKAYEKAQAQQAAYDNQAQVTANQTVQTTPTNTGYTVTPTQTATVKPTTDYSNVQVRNEVVTLVNGDGLKNFSVVVGSFGMLANAQSLQKTLGSKGYKAQIVQATVNGQPFYRVVATTFPTKEEAAQSRASLSGEYPGAWLLYQK